MIFSIIIWLVFVYIFVFFFLSRLVIPHLGFAESRLPETIPQSMEGEIEKLKNASSNKFEMVSNAYKFITGKYTGAWRKTFTRFGQLFWPLEDIWKSHGFIHCTHHNLLMRIFLLRSGFFTEKEIRTMHTFCEFNIHQYLVVSLDGKWTPVDTWAHFTGKRIGQHSGL